MAEIAFPDGIAPCFVKIFRPETGGLVNEVIGWLLARECRLNVAARAAIVEIPLNRLASRAPAWALNSSAHAVTAIAIEQIPGDPISIIHAGADDDLWDELLTQIAGRRIAAFDEWTSNNDRHAGNLIRDSSRRWWAIDFSELLGSHLWPVMRDFGIVDHQGTQLLARARKRLKDKDLRKFTSAMIGAADHHQASFKACEKAIADAILQAHGPEAANMVVSFLAQRAHRSWLPDRLKLI
ncbi:MAG: hypothetical protein ACPHN2_04715 [Sinimarinibacterium flocculans]|uniref:hypothetical protein n=1 Tax=Sinimarinibacterium flocculans TaxID=985250 RepID=UPI003C3EF01F